MRFTLSSKSIIRKCVWLSSCFVLLMGVQGCRRNPDPAPVSTQRPTTAATATQQIAQAETAVPSTDPTPRATRTRRPTATAHPFDNFLPLVNGSPASAGAADPTPYPIPTATFTPFVVRATVVPTTNPTPLPAPTDTPAPPPTAVPTAPPPTAPPAVANPATGSVDFAAVRAQIEAEGNYMAFNKIGFHGGVGGNRTGIGDWMRQLDAAGVPFFLKSVDDAGLILEAQQLVQASGVPHTLVYRNSQSDVPNYDLPPAQAAQIHWDFHTSRWPPELDRNLVWLETINENDKGKSVWLAEFATETARLALRDGYKWAAFAWSAGEPEPQDWQSPQMLTFLRLAAEHPNQIAIALHEYSFVRDDIRYNYPYQIGRFLQLFTACDQNGIARPTVLITEWGWAATSVPAPGEAMADVAWAAEIYGRFPQIKGAAIWYLGNGYGEIADQAQRLIAPMTEYSKTTYFAYPLR